MRILITNDDGIEADGIHNLRRIAEHLTDDIWLVAPISEQSCQSQSLTVKRPVRIRHFEPKVHAVIGTPTDCVFIALSEIMADNPPDLVLSCINHCSNYGQDIIYSGTVAAAREATLRGIPAISMSYRFDANLPLEWEGALHYGPKIVRHLLNIGIPKGNLININYPACRLEDIKGIKVVKSGSRNSLNKLLKRSDPYNNDYYWLCASAPSTDDEPDCDVSMIHQHYITITPIKIDTNNYELVSKLEHSFEEANIFSKIDN
ncbi:MAG: 5'/3'-nucleotidase SurE [Pseudomonadota bacterium]